MIVLDTNVLSELIKPQPASVVVDWVARHAATDLYITAITQAEIAFGVRLLPDGKRRDVLQRTVEEMFKMDFPGRVLPFDAAASIPYADIAAGRRRRGRPVSQFDAQIAAIVKSHVATLATRNVVDFLDCGITVVNPWRE